MGNKNHPKQRKSSARRRNKSANLEGSIPTERIPGNDNEASSGRAAGNHFQKASSSKVPVEKGNWAKFTEFVQAWGAILAFVSVLVTAVMWAVTLQYDVAEVKKDVNKNTGQIDSQSVKIVGLEKLQIGIEKDIDFIKDKSSNLASDLSEVETIVRDMQIKQAGSAVQSSTANE